MLLTPTLHIVQMFFVDDGAAPEQDASRDESEIDSDPSDSDDSSQDEDQDNQGTATTRGASSSTGPSWLSTSQKPSKKPLWNDPSDHTIAIDMSRDKRLRKLVREQTQQTGHAVVDGQGLESKLRQQFTSMHPEPEWASKEKRAAQKQKNAQSAAASSGGGLNGADALQALFSSTASLVTTPASRGHIAKGQLEIKRLRDANYQSRTVWDGGNGKKRVQGQQADKEKPKYVDSGLMDIKFHPRVDVLATVGSDRRLRMFHVDGHTNASLLTLHIPSLPIKTMQFHPTGTSLLLTGSRPFYYTYDLQSQRCLRSAKNLLTSGGSTSGSIQSLEKTAFSPDGSVLAVAGRRGQITLLAWGPGGTGGQVLTTLRSGKTGGVHDLLWKRGGQELWVLGDGSEVDVWELRSGRSTSRWVDQGGFGGRLLEGSKDGSYVAVGSSTGVVNVYDSSAITNTFSSSPFVGVEAGAASHPKPIRELMNLTTEITSIRFNPDAQMMAIASTKKKDAFRMVSRCSFV